MPIRMTGLVSNMDTESIIASLMSVQRTKQTKIENKITKLEWKQEIWKDFNTKMYSFYSDSLSKFRLQSSFATKKVSSSDESVATVTASNSAAEGTHSLKVSKLASSQFVTGGVAKPDNSLAVSASTKLVDLGMTVGKTITVKSGTAAEGNVVEKSMTIKEGDTVAEFLNTLKSAGLSASFDTSQQRFFISSKQSGTKNVFALTTDDDSKFDKLGLSEIKPAEDGTINYSDASGMSLIQAKDAKYQYNGVDYTSSSNNLSINGLSITLKGLSKGADTATEDDDQPINLSVSNDTKAVYDMVKSFIKTYNSLLKEMNTNYYADSSAGYEPLTDDEKKAMSDSEVEKWEKKIKDSLLRRDDTLSSLITTMRSNLTGSVKVNEKSYSLSSYGISTSSDYSEKGLLHIDGDADDSKTARNDDKLFAALEKDPDTVATVLSQLAGELYNELSKKMTSTSLRSTLTVYNDKEMKKTLTNYKKELSTMEDKLQDMENRYYKQFSAMETALAKMNSQSSSLAAMLGTKS